MFNLTMDFFLFYTRHRRPFIPIPNVDFLMKEIHSLVATKAMKTLLEEGKQKNLCYLKQQHK